MVEVSGEEWEARSQCLTSIAFLAAQKRFVKLSVATPSSKKTKTKRYLEQMIQSVNFFRWLDSHFLLSVLVND